METQFRCKNENRRERVLALGTLNGIDFLEVATPDQRTLEVRFLHPLPGEAGGVPAAPALTKDNVVIEGGSRIENVQVVDVQSAGNVLTVDVDVAGDFSTYTLRLVSSTVAHAPPPAGFDPQLASVAFGFKVQCESDFDCRVEKDCPEEPPTEPRIDYLAKDYASFRRLLLDRLSTLVPNWTERNPADAQVTLVELLAYAGDRLSYFQDAIATEAYLGTARSRVSVRRHARLLDYALHDGANARAWVRFELDGSGLWDGKELAAGTRLLTGGGDGETVVAPAGLKEALRERPVVFETLAPITLRAAHDRIELYTWSDADCCLPRGATRVTLLDPGKALALLPGDVLVLQETLGAESGLAVDADPTHRHAVRLTEVESTQDPLDGTDIVEVEWSEEDALPFPLCLSAAVVDANGTPQVVAVAAAFGNCVLADQGLSLRATPYPATVPDDDAYRPALIDPEVVPVVPEPDGTVLPGSQYRPLLASAGLTFRVPYRDEEARRRPAVEALRQEPAQALPALTLHAGDDTWEPRRDLLASGRFANELVVEMEVGEVAWVRFGDGQHGKRPPAGTTFEARYRLGNGPEGNVGAERIRRVVATPGIARVVNPMAATGGVAPESIEIARRMAPHAFRVQERAVTAADYADVAERHPEVQRASARFRWTGSWYTVFVTIDRKGGQPVTEDAEFRAEMRAHLDRYRTAGYDVEVRGPIFVPLDVVLSVCVKPGYFRSDVQRALLATLGNGVLPNRRRGFFHPDAFTFGDPVWASELYAAVLAVDGVAHADLERFQRWGMEPNGELEAGVLRVADLEIVRLDNDPSFPERGKLELVLEGGL